MAKNISKGPERANDALCNTDLVETHLATSPNPEFCTSHLRICEA
jgi:hypothetical protein